MPYSGPTQSQSVTLAHSSMTGECKPIRIATSQSAQSLKSMSSFPIPRPFAPHIHGKNDQDNIPPPLLHDSLSSAANMGLKTPSAFFPSQHHVGHTDAQLSADRQAHYLSSSTASSKQDLQYSTKFPGRDVAQTLGSTNSLEAATDEKQFINMPFHGETPVGQLSSDRQAHYLSSSTPHSSKHDSQYSTKLPGRDITQTLGSTNSLEAATDEKQFINMPFYAEAPVGQPIQILMPARDGTFVTDQQTNEIAYSTQMPVGLVSQQSKTLDISREASDHVAGKKPEFPYSSSIEVNILDKSKQIARDGVITASRHPAGMSFSEDVKTENMQNTEQISDLLLAFDPAFQHRYNSTVQNPDYGSHSVKWLSDKAEHPSLQQGEVSGTTCLQDVPSEQCAYNVGDSLSGQQGKSYPYFFSTKNGVHNIPKDCSASEYQNSDPRSLQVGQSGVSPHDATLLPSSTNAVGHIVHSLPIDGDSMPRSAHVMQQSHAAQYIEPDQEAVEHELAGKLQQLAGIRIFYPFF